MKSEILDQYLLAAENFYKLAKSFDENQLKRTPEENEWSGEFIIHHLADFEIHFSHRIIRILTEDNPLIESYDESLYAEPLSYVNRDLGVSLDSIIANRKLIHGILTKSHESALDRPAVHSVKGDIKLRNLLQSCTGHLNDHAEQLKAAVN
jgi:hypothetical protein